MFNNTNKGFYFPTPVYSFEVPQFLDMANKGCIKHLQAAKDFYQKDLKKRNELLNKDVKDMGFVYHSGSITNDPDLADLQKYIGDMSYTILIDMGYDMTQQELYWTEFWVQEFSRKGGGNHDGHIHNNNHISGFYFLKCSDKTSFPIFHDPRISKEMMQLPLIKDIKVDSPAQNKFYLKIKPGTMVFFPAYLEHEFSVDLGVEPFKFIHFNLQCIRKQIADTIRLFSKVDK
jgi:uncharacterized protein (TIGR02466 family)